MPAIDFRTAIDAERDAVYERSSPRRSRRQLN
jgi:hypothetical protein